MSRKTGTVFDYDSTFLAEGGFRDERFLTLTYNNKQGAITQFGYMLFELSPNGKKLKGKIVGYGPESEAIVWGDIMLKPFDFNEKNQ